MCDACDNDSNWKVAGPFADFKKEGRWTNQDQDVQKNLPKPVARKPGYTNQ